MEDAVARSRKDEGGELTSPLFSTDTHPRVERMVGINSLSTPDGLKDLSAIITTDAAPPSIMISKVTRAIRKQGFDELDFLSVGRKKRLMFSACERPYMDAPGLPSFSVDDDSTG